MTSASLDRLTLSIRTLLGAIVIAASVWLLTHLDAFATVISDTGLLYSTMALAHGVILIHLFGGVMLLTGILPRWAAFMQIPILVAAYSVGDIAGGLLIANSEWLSLGTLVLAFYVTAFDHGGSDLLDNLGNVDETSVTETV